MNNPYSGTQQRPPQYNQQYPGQQHSGMPMQQGILISL